MAGSWNVVVPVFGRNSSVRRGSEFLRILNLPKRSWEESDLSLAKRLTEVLKAHEGMQELRPIQAQALLEIGELGRLFGPMQVGSGKTLVSLLAPRVLESKRPLLLLPAALVEKTRREQAILAKHWRVAKHLVIWSYEEMGRISAAKKIEVYSPDLIIADECQKLKNKRAGVTRRVARYMDDHPGTRFVAISGTVMAKGLCDFAHIVKWTHKEDSPIPLEPETLQEWSDAIDLKVNPLRRKEPGALLELSTDDEGGEDVEHARRGFRQRLVSTPGVVASRDTQEYTGSLLIRALQYGVNPVTEENFKKLRTEWCTPDGWALSEGVAVWRHARELAIGLHYLWSPRPPEEWLAKRRSWAQFVRGYLSRSHSVDTELQVTNAVDAGDIKDTGPELLAQWREIKPTFDINSKPAWHDDSALNLCAEWMEKNEGIVWVEHNFFAHALAQLTGKPYFGPGGVDSKGRPIEDAKGPVIASIAANGTGRNLQKWNKNLVTTVPDHMRFEQLIGRTHRAGQEADEVTVDVLLGCAEHFYGLLKVIEAAKMQKDTIGQTPKILLADLDMPDSIQGWPGYRWMKNK